MSSTTTNPIQEFFDQYPEFPYDPTGETMSQFKELRDLKRWTWTRNERAQALDEVRNAIALQFNAFYGSNVDDLNGWHNLCRALRVQDLPDTVNGCKAVSRAVFSLAF